MNAPDLPNSDHPIEELALLVSLVGVVVGPSHLVLWWGTGGLGHRAGIDNARHRRLAQ